MAATHQVGTACELRFASDAILRNYDVYMPCCGTQKGHDLVMIRDGVWSRVQVKKATVVTTKSCTFISAALNGNRNTTIPKDQYDLLALVCLELGRTWLIPVEDVMTEKTISKSIPKLSDWNHYIF